MVEAGKNLNAKEIYDILINEDKITEESGKILFSLKDVSIVVMSRDVIGNILQNWFEEWLKKRNIIFGTPKNTQEFPDIHLNTEDRTKDLLEIKAFDLDKGANFDIANFQAYCRSLKENSYRLDADYLIFGYQMDEEGNIKIGQIWLKKIWEIAGSSEAYPLKIQQKQGVIYNIRPSVWYSKGKLKYPAFTSKKDFVMALYGTLLKYPKTKDMSKEWLNEIKINYEKHTMQNLF
jgi:hypothetical protein